MATFEPHVAAARIVQDAGGELVGRTRLQKIAFLMQLAGFGSEFKFEYRHYGPYSEDLAQAMEIAVALGPVKEEERTADWGGRYSIYTTTLHAENADRNRSEFIQQAKHIDAVELELAATAAYLFCIEGIGKEKQGNPWLETKRRKPSKSEEGRLERAFQAYNRLKSALTLASLPELPTI